MIRARDGPVDVANAVADSAAAWRPAFSRNRTVATFKWGGYVTHLVYRLLGEEDL
jgi:hypothetical protein